MKKNNKFSSRTFALSGLVALTSGCAFFDRHVDLEYDEPAITSRYTDQSPRIQVDFFENENGEIIGCVRNGYGWKTAEVKANNDPTEWIRGALEQELENAGCIVDSDSDLKVRGSLTRLYTDLRMNYDTDMNLKGELWYGGRKVDVDAFHAHTQKNALFGTGSEYATASNRALAEMMRRSVPKIATQAENFYRNNRVD